MEESLKTKTKIFYLVLFLVLEIYSVILWHHQKKFFSFWFVGAGLFCLVLPFLFPGPAALFYKVYTRAALAMLNLVTKIIMIFFFYTIFVPYGLLVRILQGDLLQRKCDRARKTYWIVRTEGKEIDRLCENPF